MEEKLTANPTAAAAYEQKIFVRKKVSITTYETGRLMILTSSYNEIAATVYLSNWTKQTLCAKFWLLAV